MRIGVWAFGLALAAGPAWADDADGPALRALMGLSGLRLDAVPSCKGAGLTRSDRTIGDMLGSIWAQFEGVRQEPPILAVKQRSGLGGAVEAEVTFHRLGGQEEWKWGFAFRYGVKSGRADPRSVRCLVAG